MSIAPRLPRRRQVQRKGSACWGSAWVRGGGSCKRLPCALCSSLQWNDYAGLFELSTLSNVKGLVAVCLVNKRRDAG
jgi:hypothetical protein